jgi:hypothetical protein
MSNYAIVNLKELEDSAAGQAAGIEARFARKYLGSEHLGVTYMRYEPVSLINPAAASAASHASEQRSVGNGRVSLSRGRSAAAKRL